MRVILPIAPRPLQAHILENMTRFFVAVCHRRFGKTILALLRILSAAFRCRYSSPRYAYVAPTMKQAKTIAWDYIQRLTEPIPGRKVNQTELKITLPGDIQIRLHGADDPDALRGIYLDGVVLDEVAQMSERVWTQILRPTLADRKGWALFIGTPSGHDFFYHLFNGARTGKFGNDWGVAKWQASETGILSDEELNAAKAEMSPEMYAQEFECDFSAGIRGAYWARAIGDLEKEGQFGFGINVPFDKACQVHTAWDLGINDPTGVWLFQVLRSGAVNVLEYYEEGDRDIGYFIEWLNQKGRSRGYVYGTHLAPWDIEQRVQFTSTPNKSGLAQTRRQIAARLGLDFTVVPRHSLEDGIESVRMLLPKCWFDYERCNIGVELLMRYRSEWNEKMRCFSKTPRHDETSHAASAIRYLAMGLHLVRDSSRSMTPDKAREQYEKWAPPRPGGLRYEHHGFRSGGWPL
ncbi:MAG: terminase family protein [Pseudomonadota bacterium]